MKAVLIFLIPALFLSVFFLGVGIGMAIEQERNPEPIISTTTP